MKRIIIFGIWMSLLLVYTSFMNIEKPNEKSNEIKASKCTGYTVIDAHTVQWCDGTIEKKDWQIKIGMN